METLRDIAPYVALGAAALSLVLLILVIVLLARVGKLRRAQTVVLGHHEQRDIVAHTEDLDTQVRNLREAVEILTDQLDDQKRHLDRALTNRAIIRYDAFRDAGGEQSASFALLDQYRSGVVFSAIAARDFARIYVKHITDGVADRDLSPEEAQAMEAAVPRPLQERRRRAEGPAGAAAREPAAGRHRRRPRTRRARRPPDARRRRRRRSTRSARPSAPSPRRATGRPAAPRTLRPAPTTSRGSRRRDRRAAAAPPAAEAAAALRGGASPPHPTEASPGLPRRRVPPAYSDSLAGTSGPSDRGDRGVAQSSDKVAFLGPEGTFTEEALLANMPEGGLHPFPYPSIRDVLRAVQAGEVPLGIVAIENALEGSVPVTLDSLASGFEDLHIVREVTHPVHQMLDHEDRRCRSTRSPR